MFRSGGGGVDDLAAPGVGGDPPGVAYLPARRGEERRAVEHDRDGAVVRGYRREDLSLRLVLLATGELGGPVAVEDLLEGGEVGVEVGPGLGAGLGGLLGLGQRAAVAGLVDVDPELGGDLLGDLAREDRKSKR